MIYKTFKEWKAGRWLEDGEPRTEAYTEDELLLVEMGWKYGFDAGKEQTKPLSDEELNKAFDYYCETDEGVLRFNYELRDEWKKEQLIRWKEAFKKASEK